MAMYAILFVEAQMLARLLPLKNGHFECVRPRSVTGFASKFQMQESSRVGRLCEVTHNERRGQSFSPVPESKDHNRNFMYISSSHY